MIISDKLNICSLNCEGLNRSFDYISSFLQHDNCDILCVQELWILECNIKTLGALAEDYFYMCISGVGFKWEFFLNFMWNMFLLIYCLYKKKNNTNCFYFA